MVVSSESPYVQRVTTVSAANSDRTSGNVNGDMEGHADTDSVMNEKINGQMNGHANGHASHIQTAAMAHPKTSIDTSSSSANTNSDDTAVDFAGDVNTNNEIPTQEALKSVEDMTVLDKDGKIIPFNSLYSGPNVTKRVLIIFIRHFLCGVSFLPPSCIASSSSPTIRPFSSRYPRSRLTL